MLDPHTLRPGDPVRLTLSEFHTLRGRIFQIAAGCAVIEWTHNPNFDPLRLTSELWRCMERDDA